MACICICFALGIDFKNIVKNISNIVAAPGRLELVSGSKNFSVLVRILEATDGKTDVLVDVAQGHDVIVVAHEHEVHIEAIIL